MDRKKILVKRIEDLEKKVDFLYKRYMHFNLNLQCDYFKNEHCVKCGMTNCIYNSQNESLKEINDLMKKILES